MSVLWASPAVAEPLAESVSSVMAISVKVFAR